MAELADAADSKSESAIFPRYRKRWMPNVYAGFRRFCLRVFWVFLPLMLHGSLTVYSQ